MSNITVTELSKLNPVEFIINYVRTRITNGTSDDMKMYYFGTFFEGASNKSFEI